jgi:hypothetical protein
MITCSSQLLAKRRSTKSPDFTNVLGGSWRLSPEVQYLSVSRFRTFLLSVEAVWTDSISHFTQVSSPRTASCQCLSPNRTTGENMGSPIKTLSHLTAIANRESFSATARARNWYSCLEITLDCVWSNQLHNSNPLVYHTLLLLSGMAKISPLTQCFGVG